MTGRTIIIGDVHGCYSEMMMLLEKLAPSRYDRVLFAGDLINKGKDSLKVIKTIMSHGYQSVMGNHEYAYLNRLYQKRMKVPYPLKQGKKYYILDDLIKLFSELENEWLTQLPYYIDEPGFTLVHAGIYPGKKLVEHAPYQILNVRMIKNKPWYEYYRIKKLIVYGHWAMQGLLIKPYSIGLDSGCVYGKKLTALILPEKKIMQVNSTTNVLD